MNQSKYAFHSGALITWLGLIVACGFSMPQDRVQGEPNESAGHEDTAVKAAIERVMAAPEYRHLVRPKQEQPRKLPAWLERLLEWLFQDDDNEVRSFSWIALVLRVLVFALAAAIAVVIAIVIVRGIMDRVPTAIGQRVDSAEALNPTSPPGERPSDEYLRQAIALAASGDHRAAIRQLLLGTMSWIERAGLIRFRRGLTNRDYLRAVWRHPAARDSMNGIIDAFERIYFGRRRATPELYESCLSNYRTGFTGHEASAVAG